MGAFFIVYGAVVLGLAAVGSAYLNLTGAALVPALIAATIAVITRSSAIAISVVAAWFILGEVLLGTFWDSLAEWGPAAVTNALAVGGIGRDKGGSRRVGRIDRRTALDQLLLDRLQPLQQPADVNDDAGTVARQQAGDVIESAPRVHGEVAEVGLAADRAARGPRGVAHGGAGTQLCPFDQAAHPFPGLDLVWGEERRLPIAGRCQPRQRALREVPLDAGAVAARQAVLRGVGVGVQQLL